MATQDRNIVEFGLCELHICTYEKSGSTVTLGTPVALPGAKNLSAEVDETQNKFYADDRTYWVGYDDNGITGEIEVAKFPDAIKKAFFGYQETAQGGLASVRGASKPNVCILFQFKGDVENRRGVIYNATLGNIQRTYATNEDKTDPVTEKCSFTAMGDEITGITKDVLGPTATGYATLFTAPQAPQFASSDSAEIESFVIGESVGVVNHAQRTVAVTVPNGTSKTALVANFTLSAGASAKVGNTTQVSGTTSNDFTNNVTYKVKAANGTTEVNWVVSVSVASA